MAQIIIAKHRKGATGDVLLTFRGEFTRFENPEDALLDSRAASGNSGEIRGSIINGEAAGGASLAVNPQNPFEGTALPHADNVELPPANNSPLPF
jgi:hypothetical protein